MKIHLRTFGCRANHYDSESVREMIEDAGHVVVADPADADVAVFNGCAVTAEAEADLRQAVRRAARARPALRSVVIGCVAALPPESPGGRALRALPTVSAVIPEHDDGAVAVALGIAPPAHRRRAVRQRSARALLRIQDGCDEHCTFCLTTLARGASRSRPAAELVEEASALAERHPEIVITGIHIGSYGLDRGSSLGALMESLVRQVAGVRFRLSSLEATEVDSRLFDLLRDDAGRVVPHLHAPLQSGSDRLLRHMGRHWYTAASYAAAVERLVHGRAVFGLGADVIAGFPGETEEDHRATLALVESLPFTYLHVFPYSPRPGTAAERLGGDVPPAVAQRRARELRAVGEQKARAYAERRVGGIADAVVVRSAAGAAIGEAVTEDYLTVLPGNPGIPRRTRYRARLVKVNGRLVAEPADGR